MNRVPEVAVNVDILTELAESGLGSAESFAGELGVPAEWVEYWLAFAKVRRGRYAGDGSQDRS